MKLIALVSLLITVGTLSAADPLAGAFFAPEVILTASDQIGLTPEQQETVRDHVQQTQSRSEELRQRLERETAALSALAQQEQVDEPALIAQLDKLLDAERDLKHLHIGLLAALKNSLTSEQQTKLREFAGKGPAAQEKQKRLTDKVNRVKEGAQSWAASGRDPSVIARMMEENVRPLIEAGKATQAEAELDRVLEQLEQDGQ